MRINLAISAVFVSSEGMVDYLYPFSFIVLENIFWWMVLVMEQFSKASDFHEVLNL